MLSSTDKCSFFEYYSFTKYFYYQYNKTLENLFQKTINSVKWSLLEKVVSLGFEFAVGIVLARLLIPSDFGTVAIITAIIAFFLIFVNSGFSQSLIRDLNVNHRDYCTIYFFNLIFGITLYVLVFFVSTYVADFYENDDLELYLKVLGLSILISTFTIVQRVILTREMNFKLLSKISIVSSFLSGILSLILAFSGFGIWSLIVKGLAGQFIQTVLFWFYNKWRPTFIFDLAIFKRHFKYSFHFLLSGSIGQIYNNILSLTIGKIYNLQTLGLYNRAQLFSNIVSVYLESIMTSVSFPALAKIQGDRDKFLLGVRLLLKQAIYVIGILLVMLFFSSKVLIPFILGPQWADAGIYLQYLCVIGFFGVLNSILVNSISVTGRSDIYLYLQILTLVFNVISLVFGYFYGFEMMLLILIFFIILSYILISVVFGSLFHYTLIGQIKDFQSIIAVFLVIISIGIIFTFVIGSSIKIISLMLFIQAVSVLLVSSSLKIEEFLLIKKYLNYEKNNK